MLTYDYNPKQPCVNLKITRARKSNRDGPPGWASNFSSHFHKGLRLIIKSPGSTPRACNVKKVFAQQIIIYHLLGYELQMLNKHINKRGLLAQV